MLGGPHVPAQLAQRFAREARVLARLRHDHIVPVYEADLQHGQPYFVMELIRGGSLAERLRRSPPAAAEAARLVEAVARGVQAAHAAGVVHRDLKPANVLLTEDGTPKVADFGLAKLAEPDGDATRSGVALGTPAYMAPEQARGEQGRVGPATDVYALGAILYECLTGRPPFLASDRADILSQVLHHEPVAPTRLQPKVPRDLETICLKCLQKEPPRRYASAEALADDLRRFREGRTILARPVGSSEKLWRWSRRNPALASLGAAVFLMLVLVTVVTSIGYVREFQLRNAAQTATDQALAAEAQARREWYSASINLAQQAWESDDVPRLRALLAETESYPERGFEWYYLQRLCHLELFSLIGHRGPVTTVAWSPDRLRLVTGSADGTVKVWEAASGHELLTLRGHLSTVRSVAWSPDGQQLATGSADGTAKIWVVGSGRKLRTLRGHTGPVWSVAWSPDGQRLATGSADRTARLWQAADGRELRIFTGHSHPDDLPMLGASTVGLIGSLEGQGAFLAGSALCPGRPLPFRFLPSWPDEEWETNGGEVRSVAWSPDGQRLVTGSADSTARIWEVASGRSLHILRGHTGQVWSVAWSPEGDQVATGGADATVKVWQVSNDREPRTLTGHKDRVMSVGWSPDAKWLRTASHDGTARVWEAASGREHQSFKGHADPLWSAVWTPDGQQLATASADGTVRVWDVASSQDLRKLEGHKDRVTSVAWSPDGQRLATVSWDGTVKVSEPASGREPRTLKTGSVMDHMQKDVTITWSPDGKRLATAGRDETAKVWDVASGLPLFACKGHTYMINAIAWSPDGQRLATASGDGTVRVWEASRGRGQHILQGHASPVFSVSWSPDGQRLATGGRDAKVRVWEAASGLELFTINDTGPVYTVIWSPDGQQLATSNGGSGAGREATRNGDSMVKVYDATDPDHQELLSLKGQVTDVTWSPDGLRLATGRSDGTVKLWEIASGRELLTLKGSRSPVQSVSWSRDGLRLATGSVNGDVQVWERATPAAVQRWARQEREVEQLQSLLTVRGPQAKGFLQNWLLLLPLPVNPEDSWRTHLEQELLADEANLRPQAGQRVRIGGQEFVWKNYRAPKAVVDFNAVLGRVSERSVVYAVCYLDSERARDDLWLQVGSDDQSKVYLNGHQVYAHPQVRELVVLDLAPVVLRQGTNVLVFKVVNEGGGWEGCVRLVDGDGRPAQGIHVRLTP
jgi:WD40 repeat protein